MRKPKLRELGEAIKAVVLGPYTTKFPAEPSPAPPAYRGKGKFQEDKCIGCGDCIEACIFSPSRISFNLDKNVYIKCDLCQNTPYWDSQGKQACIEVCPVKAIKFATKKPIGDTGYRVSLRGEGWSKLGLPTD